MPPMGLNASGVACWWSIVRLIQQRKKCYFWTLTFKEVHPDHYCGNMHGKLMLEMNRLVRRGKLPVWGGVRVSEISGKEHSHGLHFHWVIYPRLPIKAILAAAERCGFGRIQVDPRPATELVANYLSKYLVKQGPLSGVRKWDCIGNYSGVRARDVQFESRSVAVFRETYQTAIKHGANKSIAWNLARVEQRAFDTEADDREPSVEIVPRRNGARSLATSPYQAYQRKGDRIGMASIRGFVPVSNPF